ncbi:hypothetical protein J2Z45_004168 [Cohnella lubricantis]|nr:hypothetical protein [Cohnella lubricantis]
MTEGIPNSQTRAPEPSDPKKQGRSAAKKKSK